MVKFIKKTNFNKNKKKLTRFIKVPNSNHADFNILQKIYMYFIFLFWSKRGESNMQIITC